MKTRRGILGVLLTLALALSLAPALGGTAKAANAETLYIAGKTGEAYGYEEQGAYEWNNWVYDEGWTALASGGSVSFGSQ